MSYSRAQRSDASEPLTAAPRSRVKHSTFEPLYQQITEEDPNLKLCIKYIYQDVNHSFMM